MTVMVRDVAENSRQKHKEWLAMLTKQYNATWEQIFTTVDRDIQVTLEAKIKALESQMQKAKDDLNALDRKDSTNPERQQRAWKEHYEKLDFEKQWRLFNDIYNGYLQSRSGGALMLLLPDRNNMCADLLIRRMDTWLKENVGYRKVHFKEVQIVDSSKLTNTQFLERLGTYYKHPLLNHGTTIMDAPGLHKHTEQLVHKMLNPLGPSDVLLVDITLGRGLYEAQDFVNWLVDGFWKLLVQTLNQVAEEHPYIKCIVCLSALDPFPAELPNAERYSRGEQICPEDLKRIICFLLTRWNEDAIEAWLYQYTDWPDTLTSNEIREKAHQIFLDGGDGVPNQVLQSLERQFEAQSKLRAE